MDFSGFDEWIEIFRGGPQIDNQSRRYDGSRLIDQAVASFNAKEHEPPLVVGHPQENAPAFGWVKALRKRIKDGAVVLEAKMGQVQPEFEDWVRRGLFKKRSASFYEDGRLRHVGFLGAAPPAVLGLAEISFKGDPGIVFEFNEAGGESMDFSGLTDFVKAIAGIQKPAAVQDPPAATAPAVAAPAATAPAAPAAPGPAFSEAQVKQMVVEAEARGRAAAAAEFAEQQAAQAAEHRKEGLKSEVDRLVEAGKVAPAFAEDLKAELLVLDGSGPIEFSEGQKGTLADKKLARLKASTGPEHLFTELATKDKAADFSQAKSDEEEAKSIAARVNPVQ